MFIHFPHQPGFKKSQTNSGGPEKTKHMSSGILFKNAPSECNAPTPGLAPSSSRRLPKATALDFLAPPKVQPDASGRVAWLPKSRRKPSEAQHKGSLTKPTSQNLPPCDDCLMMRPNSCTELPYSNQTAEQQLTSSTPFRRTSKKSMARFPKSCRRTSHQIG